MTAKELQNGECYKFVLVNGELRFCTNNGFMSHSDMVREGERATAAGMIGVYEKDWTIVDNWSMTLKIGMNNEAETVLTRELGRPLARPTY